MATTNTLDVFRASGAVLREAAAGTGANAKAAKAELARRKAGRQAAKVASPSA